MREVSLLFLENPSAHNFVISDDSWGDPTIFAHFPLYQQLQGVGVGITTFSAQLFFAWRIFIVQERSVWISGFIAILSMAQLGGCIYVMVSIRRSSADTSLCSVCCVDHREYCDVPQCHIRSSIQAVRNDIIPPSVLSSLSLPSIITGIFRNMCEDLPAWK